jgi:hypothetical protein
MNLKNKAARAAVERKMRQRRGKPQTVVTVERTENAQTAHPPTGHDLEREIAEAKITELERANAKLKRRVRSVREMIEG